MRQLLLTLILLFFTKLSFGGEKWWTQTVRSDYKNFYYVGISDGQTNLQNAMTEAYNEALKEAVRHQYGFNNKVVESFYSTLKSTELNQEMFLEQENVEIKGVQPGRQHVLKIKGKYLVHREIIYSKRSINKERARLKRMKQKRMPKQRYSIPGKNNGKLLITTFPTQAEVVLTSENGKIQMSGSSNAEFSIPLGNYDLMVNKEGHSPYTGEVLVTGNQNTRNIKLKPNFGTLKFDVEPSNALITVDGRPVRGRKIKLQTHRDYEIRVTHEDYYTSSEAVSLSVNEDFTLKKELRPRPAKITIHSNPQKAKVYINDKRVGITPLRNFELPPGKHEIVVKKDKYISKYETIRVKANTRPKPLIFKMKFGKDKPRRTLASFKLPKFKCTKTKEFSLASYIPLSTHGSDLKFNLVPMGFENRICKNFSWGMDFTWHYDVDTVEDDYSDGRYYSGGTETDTNDVLISLKYRYYFFKHGRYELGTGPEFNHHYISIEEYVNYQYTNITKTKRNTLGYGFTLLKRPTKVHRTGHQFDLRQIEIGDGASFRLSWALNWEF